jgi:hypothetical protein
MTLPHPSRVSHKYYGLKPRLQACTSRRKSRAQENPESEIALRGFLTRKTTPRDLYVTTVMAIALNHGCTEQERFITRLGQIRFQAEISAFNRRSAHPGSKTNGSAALPFVIPSEAEGSAVPRTFLEMFFDGAKPDFLPRGTGHGNVCAFLLRKGACISRNPLLIS